MAITVKHSKVSTIPDDADTNLVRPSDWNADHTLVGLGTMAEQNANSVAITGGTVSGTTLTSDTVSNNLDFTPTTAPSYSEGRVWYDSTEKALAFYNDSSALAVHVSQDLIFKVINNTGTTIPNGSPVYVTSTSSGQTYPNVALAKADVAATSAVIGLTNGAIASGAIGYVTSQGTIDNVNTGTFTVGQVLYLSPYSAGQLMNTIPPTGITVQVGVATFINSSTGHIYVKQTTPLAVPASIITGQVAIANGGTAASTASTAFNNLSPLTTAGDTLYGGTSGAGTRLAIGTAGQVLTVNSGATAPQWSTLTAGTVTSVGGTGTVSGISLSGTVTSSGNLTLGGTLDLSSPPTIGNTAPNTGKFTTLESTGTGSFGTTSAQYIQAVGNATYPQIKAAGSGTDIPLVLQPKGTGALQAQLTDSTATGGNARGANAVDWQTSRATAAQVASGSTSAILGGSNNTSSATGSMVGGRSNVASAQDAVVSGGNSNTASGINSGIASGVSNTAAGYFNFIGGGYTNSGTALAAVTTQSGTMNGTANVTLSGSNANIKVGQYITGTSIAANTYVLAIAGTFLTLSQNASGSSTSTLSFFTPHGVVVGGGNNQATGSHSFIGGGGDASLAANRNVASGDWSAVVGGGKNQATGIGSFVGGGGISPLTTIFGNTASGLSSFVGGGISNAASGTYSFVGGGSFGNTRSISGYHAFPACDNPFNGSTAGISQAALLILARQTTDATPTSLRSNGATASGTNQITLPVNSAFYFRGEVVSGVTGGGNTKGWYIEGVIKKGATNASTALVGTPTVTSLYADAGAATWALAVTADTTNGSLTVTFTGQASTTIRTVCQIRTTEMGY